jgi:putative membrane protein insertion efficiency factor
MTSHHQSFKENKFDANLSKIFLLIIKLVKALPIALIYIYKYFLSPILPRSCRYLPSCSDYAIQSIQRFGVVYGLILTVKRLLRCHPFCNHGGIDEVPVKRDGKII